MTSIATIQHWENAPPRHADGRGFPGWLKYTEIHRDCSDASCSERYHSNPSMPRICHILKPLSLLCGVAATMTHLGCSDQDSAKVKELDSLPVGLSVTHVPNPASARSGGKSGSKYTWIYSTTVRAIDKPLKVVEFGSLAKINGAWRQTNVVNRPFTDAEFAEWYSCPNAELRPGAPAVDPSNWGGSDQLEAIQMRWYYIGVDRNGNKFKGEAIVDQSAILSRD